MDDEQFVSEVLRTVANCSWQARWHSYTNQAEPDITTIQPRNGLFIHVRLWAGQEEFTVVSITDIDVSRAV